MRASSPRCCARVTDRTPAADARGSGPRPGSPRRSVIRSPAGGRSYSVRERTPVRTTTGVVSFMTFAVLDVLVLAVRLAVLAPSGLSPRSACSISSWENTTFSSKPVASVPEAAGVHSLGQVREVFPRQRLHSRVEPIGCDLHAVLVSLDTDVGLRQSLDDLGEPLRGRREGPALRYRRRALAPQPVSVRIVRSWTVLIA